MVDSITTQEVVNQVTKVSIPTFDEATAITSSIPFIIFLIVGLFVILFAYIIWASITSAKTSDGRKIPGTKVIQSANFWLSFFLILALLTVFIILIIFPIWLILIENIVEIVSK